MPVYESILELLEKQAQTQNSLLEIEGRKTSALAKGDIDALGALIKLEQPLVMRSAALERRHEELRRKLALEGSGFKQYVDGLAPDRARAVEDGLNKLSVAARRLKRAVHVNMGILNARQRTIRQLLSFCGVQEQTLTYNKEGRYTAQAGGM